MNHITLARTSMTVSNLRIAAFWMELDRAIEKLHGTVLIHSSEARDYRLPTIELRVRLVDQVITVSWVSPTPVLDARGRIDLRQSADAWLDTLAALTVRPAPVAARVHAASALLAAGFESVAVANSGFDNQPLFDQALAA